MRSTIPQRGDDPRDARSWRNQPGDSRSSASAAASPSTVIRPFDSIGNPAPTHRPEPALEVAGEGLVADAERLPDEVVGITRTVEDEDDRPIRLDDPAEPHRE